MLISCVGNRLFFVFGNYVFIQERISSQVVSSDESSLRNIIVNFYIVQQGFLHFFVEFLSYYWMIFQSKWHYSALGKF